jgi:peptidyl-prolyl cis-trans isomerase C
MKKLNLAVLAAVFATTSFAETLYVNGKPVDQKVIDQAMAQFKKSSPMAAQQMNNPQFKKELLQSVGMQQAILQEGNSQGLDKTPAYQEKLQEIKPMVYAQILQEKASSGQITDAQVKAKYDQMKQQSANQKQYDVSHILVKDQKTANDIEAQLKKGANFADLAKKYSVDPGSKAKGGELGWSDGSNYVPEFTAAIKTLQKGQYTTTPVKSQFGYHIIKLNDVKTGAANSLPPFDKVKDQLKQQLQMEKTRAFFDGLKAKYKVEVK